MSETLAALDASIRDLESRIHGLLTQLEDLRESLRSGEIDPDRYDQLATSINNQIRILGVQLSSLRDRRESLASAAAKTGEEAQKATEETKKTEETVKKVEMADEKTRIEAADLYRRADTIYSQYKAGIIKPDYYQDQIARINARLKEIGWAEWKEPAPPPVKPEEEPEKASAVSLGQIAEMMKSYGVVIPDNIDPQIASKIQSLVVQKAKEAAVIPESAVAGLESPVDREAAAKLAMGIGIGIVVAVAGLATAGILAEAASLGQMETVFDGLMEVAKATGLEYLGPALTALPLESGVIEPARQYWRSVHLSSLPGPSDLIRFVVREVLPPEKFYHWMKYHGYDEYWSKCYWDAHWVLPAYSYVVEAYHRGLLTREELERFMVWHDYSPEPRPGVSKSDIEIMGILTKTPIPRVDLRRGWELGLLSDEELEERYRHLGYEEDAPLMAEIHKAEALASERDACARAAGRLFRDGKINEARFREVLKALKIVGDRQDLWVYRYQLEALAKPSKEEEIAEELAKKPPEETE
jgi:hypothetical protein